MLSTALWELRWQASRLAPTMCAAALLVALAILTGSWSRSTTEGEANVLAAQGAQSWVASSTAFGPFSAPPTLTDESLAELRLNPSIYQADPVLAGLAAATSGGDVIDVMVLGVITDGLGGVDDVNSGVASVVPGQIIVSQEIAASVGDRLGFPGRSLEVVGTARRLSGIGGRPVVIVHLDDAREMFVAGRPVATMFAIRSGIAELPDHLRAFSAAEARGDLARSMADVRGRARLFATLLWIAAALMCCAAGWTLANAQVRDADVERSFGIGPATFGRTIAIQSLTLAAGGLAVGVVLAWLIDASRVIANASILGLGSLRAPLVALVPITLLTIASGIPRITGSAAANDPFLVEGAGR